MRLDFRAKLLRYLLTFKADRGLTVIELVVVMVIIGILSALALPSIFDHAIKARQSEAQTYVGMINRAQQVYYMEQGQFGALEHLEIGVAQTTVNYAYTSAPDAIGIAAETIAMPIATVRGYAGKVWIDQTYAGVATTLTLLCEGEVGAVPIIIGNTCP